MKTLNRILTAAFFALCLSMTALADLLPIPPEPEPEKSPVVPVLIFAVLVIAACVLFVILRRRRR